MDRRVFKDNNYTVRIPLLKRMSSGATQQAPATGLVVSAFFSLAKGGAQQGGTHGITLTEDPLTPGLYGGDIQGANITTDLFSGAITQDGQRIWLRLVATGTRLNLSLP